MSDGESSDEKEDAGRRRLLDADGQHPHQRKQIGSQTIVPTSALDILSSSETQLGVTDGDDGAKNSSESASASEPSLPRRQWDLESAELFQQTLSGRPESTEREQASPRRHGESWFLPQGIQDISPNTSPKRPKPLPGETKHDMPSVSEADAKSPNVHRAHGESWLCTQPTSQITGGGGNTQSQSARAGRQKLAGVQESPVVSRRPNVPKADDMLHESPNSLELNTSHMDASQDSVSQKLPRRHGESWMSEALPSGQTMLGAGQTVHGARPQSPRHAQPKLGALHEIPMGRKASDTRKPEEPQLLFDGNQRGPESSMADAKADLALGAGVLPASHRGKGTPRGQKSHRDGRNDRKAKTENEFQDSSAGLQHTKNEIHSRSRSASHQRSSRSSHSGASSDRSSRTGSRDQRTRSDGKTEHRMPSALRSSRSSQRDHAGNSLRHNLHNRVSRPKKGRSQDRSSDGRNTDPTTFPLNILWHDAVGHWRLLCTFRTGSDEWTGQIVKEAIEASQDIAIVKQRLLKPVHSSSHWVELRGTDPVAELPRSADGSVTLHLTLRGKEQVEWLQKVSKRGTCLSAARDCVRKDPEVALAAVQQDGRALQYVADSLRKDRQIVLEAVRQDGYALRYASRILQKDPDIVRAAVQQNGLALHFAAASQAGAPEVAIEAINQNVLAAQFVGSDLRATLSVSDESSPWSRSLQSSVGSNDSSFQLSKKKKKFEADGRWPMCKDYSPTATLAASPLERLRRHNQVSQRKGRRKSAKKGRADDKHRRLAVTAPELRKAGGIRLPLLTTAGGSCTKENYTNTMKNALWD